MSDLELFTQARDELRLWLKQLEGHEPRNATVDADRITPLINALGERIKAPVGNRMYDLTFAERCVLAALGHHRGLTPADGAVISKVQNYVAELERRLLILSDLEGRVAAVEAELAARKAGS